MMELAVMVNLRGKTAISIAAALRWLSCLNWNKTQDY